MLQEFIPGGDELLWTLGAAIAEDGEVLATFSGRKLRQTRTNMGSARVGEAVWDEEVVDSGLALLRGASASTASPRWSGSATRATGGSS